MTEETQLILGKLDLLGSQMNDGFETLNERINLIDEKVDRVDQKLARTNVTIENEISKKIDIIGEGHDFLKQRLDEALQMEIKKIKEHLNIA